MTLSTEQIHSIAKLAKLSIDEQDLSQLSDNFDSIMQLIDQMSEADTNGVEPLAHPQDPALRLRDDLVTQADCRDAFLALTPHDSDGLYLVPKVIE